MNRLALVSSLLGSLSVIGCGSVAPDDNDMGDVNVTAPPTITSVTPSAGQAGIPADAAIVISFSEPMDRASVAAAYASAQLPADAVTMSWNDAGDTLTISPKQPLALAEGIGNDPAAVAAKAYALSLAASAVDLAGNALTGPLELAFTTQKRMATTAGIVADLTRYRVSNGGVAPVGADLRIGDNAMLTYRGFVTFDLSALPEDIEVEAAKFGVRQSAVIGTPFDLGVVNTVHLTYTTVNSTAWNAPALATMDPLTTTAALGPRSVEVSSAVAADYSDRVARGNHTQFRLEFPTPHNGDGDQDNIELATATFEMSLTYLAQ